MQFASDIVATVLELKSRQDIVDCIHRYCRGVDRFDRELVLSAYHPDAVDDHGLFVGLAADFVDWAFAYHREHQVSHHHSVFNHNCELAGDIAHTETYYLFEGVNKVGPVTLGGGRYIDRFERRSGKWAIAARICINEWVAELGSDPVPIDFRTALSNCTSSRDRSDVSYSRPLQITRYPGGDPQQD